MNQLVVSGSTSPMPRRAAASPRRRWCRRRRPRRRCRVTAGIAQATMIAVVSDAARPRPEAEQQHRDERADHDREDDARPRRTPTVLGSAVRPQQRVGEDLAEVVEPDPVEPALTQLAQAEVLEGERDDPEQRVDAAGPPAPRSAGASSSHGSQPGVSRPPVPPPSGGAGGPLTGLVVVPLRGGLLRRRHACGQSPRSKIVVHLVGRGRRRRRPPRPSPDRIVWSIAEIVFLPWTWP